MLKFDDLVFGNSVNDFNRIDSGVKATSISPEEPSINIFKVGTGSGAGCDFDPTKDIGIIDPDEPSTDDDDNETPAPSEPTSPSTPSTPKTGGGTETPVDNNAGDDKDKNTEDMPIVPEPANPSAPGSTGNSGGEDETAPADGDKKKDETSIPNEPAPPSKPCVPANEAHNPPSMDDDNGNAGDDESATNELPIIENNTAKGLDKKENIGENKIMAESFKTHSKKLVDTDAQVAAMMFGGNTALQKGFMRESLPFEDRPIDWSKKTGILDVDSSLFQESGYNHKTRSEVKLGQNGGSIVDYGCTLTAYTRIGNTLNSTKNDYDLLEANQIALDKDLYVGDNKNLLDKWSGGPALIENITNNKFDANFVASLSNCDLNSYGKELEILKNSTKKLYAVTVRLSTGHTVNMNSDGIIKEPDGNYLLQIKNTSDGKYLPCADDGIIRDNTDIERIDIFELVPQQAK